MAHDKEEHSRLPPLIPMMVLNTIPTFINDINEIELVTVEIMQDGGIRESIEINFVGNFFYQMSWIT